MLVLLQENCRYVFRSKMIYLILVFSSLVHLAGMKFLNHLTLSIQGVVSIIGPKEAVYTALFLQVFSSLSIASVYGIWMAPYAHRGEKSILTHVLPVPKIQFPICYIICCGLLLLINFIVMIVTFASVFGFSSLNPELFPWIFILKTFLFQGLCLEVLMLGLALSSLMFGQVATFFISGSLLFVLQIVGTFARFFKEAAEESYFSAKGILVWLYLKLPPFGSFVFDLKELMSSGRIPFENLILWVVWLVLFSLLFWAKVRYPNPARSTEA